MIFKTGITKEELKKAHNEQAERVFPVFRKNGSFICFMDFASYADFVAVTGKDFGTYMDEHDPKWFDSEKITAFKVEKKSIEVLNTIRVKNEEESIRKATAIMLKLHSKQDYIDACKKKYPRSFFDDLYPLKVM